MNCGNRFVSTPKLPWEAGFLKDVLGGGAPSSLPWLTPVVIPRDLPSSGPSWLKVTPPVSEKRTRAKSQMLATLSFGRDKDRPNLWLSG